MKRSGFLNPKLTRLCRLLDIDLAYARGILESTWHVTAMHTPAGDVGKWDDQEIADQIGFTKASGEELTNALVDAGFVDRDDTHRLVVHDWPHHCEDSVHAVLARAGKVFADGSRPKTSKLSAEERRRLDDQSVTSANGSQRQPTAAVSRRQPPAAASGRQRQPARP